MSTAHDTQPVNPESAGPKNTEESLPPKQWQCGDPYVFAPPKVDGDPWEQLLNPLLEVDTARCNAWKEEVQNLLIFAGLFSGVLSAFIIQSSQSLQPNPNDAILNILTHIATRLDNPNSATTPLSLISESPSASSIRINIFWFISLVLSLTTVLIGIVCLQWLREYQNYTGAPNFKIKLALYNMRQEGLEAWHVPQIFSSLPLLLQVALVLFLIGLCDFLIPFGPAISAPVITIIGIPILFIVSTTILPTLQASQFMASRSKDIPTQCPYKSTQSQVFRRIMTLSEAGFRIFLKIVHVALRALGFLEGALRRLTLVFKHRSAAPVEHTDQKISINIYDVWTKQTWLSFDEAWLTARETYAEARLMPKNITSYSFSDAATAGPLYDISTCLRSISQNFNFSFLQLATSYHCIDDMRISILNSKKMSIENLQDSYYLYLQTLLSYRNPLDLDNDRDFFISRHENPSSAMIKDEYYLAFVSRDLHSDKSMQHHFLELQIRLMNELYPKSTLAYLGRASNTLPSYPEDSLFDCYWDKSFHKIHFPRAITTQFSLTIESFFSVCTDTAIIDDDFFASNHASFRFEELLGLAIILQADDKIQDIVDIISNNLVGYLDGKIQQSHKRSDIIFYAACFYTRTTLSQGWFVFSFFKEVDIPAIDAFLPILRRYRSEMQPDEALGAKLGLPKFSLDEDDWWSFLGLSTLPQINKSTMIATQDVQSNDNPLDAHQSYPINALKALPSSSNTSILNLQTPSPILDQDSGPQLNPNAADEV